MVTPGDLEFSMGEDSRMRPIAKSVESYERAIKSTPGPQSNLRRLWEGAHMRFIVKGQGAHLWDVDGNDYINYAIGLDRGRCRWDTGVC